MSEARITGVATVAIPVADQQRAVDFYVGTLGFNKRRDLPYGQGRWIEVAPPGAATGIALVPEGVPTGIRLITGDADAAHAGLAGRGVDTDPEVIHGAGAAPPMFAMRDPDGNSLIVIGMGSTQ
jgi:catechol 2,3-dioxygenase-like lactoylglutathione lyase family enzyme